MSGRGVLRWAAAGLAVAVPLMAAAASPLLQWRDPVYILAGFAGIMGLGLLLLQPLIILRTLPAGSVQKLHGWIGAGLVLAVLVHVGGLWLTSPPDVIDVLLFRSPTPFGVWGALAMWGVIAAAGLAAVRRRLGVRFWRVGHSAAITLAVLGTVAHAWLIQGTMEVATKAMLCVLVLCATIWALKTRRAWRVLR